MANQPVQRRAPRKNAPSLAPLYGAIGLAILAIVAIALAQKDKDARADAENQPASTSNEVANPFADLPPGGKPIPSAFDTESLGSFKPSAEGLLANPVLTAAIEKSERAKALLKEASEASAKGDRKTYHEKALEARELYHAALEETAEWEYEISEAHGEADAQVGKVRALRSIWFDERKKLRSVDVNDL
ncbi:MAG: hypothetical protein KDB61_01280 [Planctomycetes bacterium]|nr:hypothetical protein [Planctomycetota bacterium]